MGLFGKLFGEKEKEVIEEVEEIQQAPAINPHATMIQNEILCNACGGKVEGTPRCFNMNGRKMMFHKKCFKKLKQGNVQI
jgi:hypothetical protein